MSDPGWETRDEEVVLASSLEALLLVEGVVWSTLKRKEMKRMDQRNGQTKLFSLTCFQFPKDEKSGIVNAIVGQKPRSQGVE